MEVALVDEAPGADGASLWANSRWKALLVSKKKTASVVVASIVSCSLFSVEVEMNMVLASSDGDETRKERRLCLEHLVMDTDVEVWMDRRP